MRENIQKRISELRSEYESGQKMMAELEAKQGKLREQLFRISGAIQVLEELVATPNDDTASNVSELQRLGERV